MILAYLIISASTIKFFVDPVIYRSRVEVQDSVSKTAVQVQDIYYAEFNCEIPYQELIYEEIQNEGEKSIVSKTQIRFKLVDRTHADSLIDTMNRYFSIPSFKTAAKEEMTFIVQFGMFVNEGSYEWEVAVLSGDRQGTTAKSIEVKKADYVISDLLLASNITYDTSKNYLCKGNLKVVPRPSHIFQERDKNIYVYYEIYEGETKVDRLTATYSIVDTSGKLVRKVSKVIEKTSGVQPVNAGLNIQNVATGDYVFKVELNDSNTARLIVKEILFRIVRGAAQKVSYEGLPYYEEVEYFVSPEEYKYLKSLSKEGKATYLKKFWGTHDYYEIAERFDYAKEHFAQGGVLGYKTDRGRVYIKFGEPDDVERTTIEIEESRPYEKWTYYNGVIFIFVDIRGTNEYTLIWTNARGERCQPSMYGYLPQSIRREIEE